MYNSNIVITAVKMFRCTGQGFFSKNGVDNYDGDCIGDNLMSVSHKRLHSGRLLSYSQILDLC